MKTIFDTSPLFSYNAEKSPTTTGGNIVTTWTEKRRLYLDWERAAQKLVEAGYNRQNWPNPNVPVTFHQNGETVILVRETPQAKWTVKVLEPLKQ